MGIISTAVYQMDALRRANFRELKQGDECLAGRYAHEADIDGIMTRTQEIKAEIVAEESRARPDMVRLARLRKIDKLLADTLAKCR